MSGFRELVQEAARPLIEADMDHRDALVAQITDRLRGLTKGRYLSVHKGSLSSVVVNFADAPAGARDLEVLNAQKRLLLVIHTTDRFNQPVEQMEVSVTLKIGLRGVAGLASKKGTAEQIVTHVVRLVTKAAATYGSN